MRFTDHQFYYMRRLASGVVKEEFWKWDQRQTRGLYFRGMFKFVNPTREDPTYATLTRAGWDAYKKCTTAKFRNDPTRPIFKIKGARYGRAKVG